MLQKHKHEHQIATDHKHGNSTTTTNVHNYADGDIYKEVLKATNHRK